MTAAYFSSSLNVLLVGFGLIFAVSHFSMHIPCTVAFSMELIHRDSPESPLHDPASTPLSRLRAASRADFLRNSASARITNHRYQHLMRVHIGSQRLRASAFIDTCSDLNWLFCDPCNHCYNGTQSMFNPNSSETYNKISCHDSKCFELQHKCDEHDKCKYSYNYVGGFSLTGLLSNDTLELRSDDNKESVDLKEFIFGCTHSIEGKFVDKSLGIIGLGGGKLSLVNQLGSSYERKFSYCLASSFRKSSQIYFGSEGTVSGPETVTTPLFYEVGSTYKLRLETITVAGDEEEPIIVAPPQGSGGNIKIDTGSFLTFMNREALQDLCRLVEKHTPFPKNLKVHNGDMHDLKGTFELCFNISKYVPKNYEMPEITFKFAGGALLVLREMNAFVPIGKDLSCLAMLSNDLSGGYSILGNLAQQNNRFGYDLDAGKLNFHHEDC